MIDKDKPRTADEAVAAELKGVPEEFLDNGVGGPETEGQAGVEDALASLRADLEAATQEALYAKAETQNVRRRMEKDVQDARHYAATGFARDVLSISANRSEEHTSELQSLMRISYAVFCLKKNKQHIMINYEH